MGVVTSLPLVGRAPDQLPEAVQLDALLVDQLRVTVPLLATAAVLAEMVTDIGGGALLPPPPPQPVDRIPSSSAAAQVRTRFCNGCLICCCLLFAARHRTHFT